MKSRFRRILRAAYWIFTFQAGRRFHEARVVTTLRESDLFDEEFYRVGCPELSRLGFDPVLHYVRAGAQEGRWPSPVFDAEFYLSTYPDVAESGINPLYHFIIFGAQELRWPNALFDTGYYVRENSSVVSMGLNPLAHYRHAGARTGRLPHPDFDPVAHARAHPELAPNGVDSLGHALRERFTLNARDNESAASDATTPAPRIAVVIHLFYTDLWEEISGYLTNITEPFDLFVSVCQETQHQIEQRIRIVHPDAIVRVFDNRGRDIGPFLEFLRDAGLQDYELVCKIHSKKSPHRLDGGRWRGDLLHRLLGSSDTVSEIIESFENDPHLGLLGPISSLDKSKESWGSNKDRMVSLAKRMGVPADDLHLSFFAGSMFWFRPAALEPIRQLELRLEDFEPERGELDGHLHHSLERLFSVSVKAAGYRKHAFESAALAALHGRPIGHRRIKLIAFYLPQFHPIPENDEWWGRGFTEWTNVPRARALYKGHLQPRRPSDLGYTDLRLPETRAAQAAMAKEYGIQGFCYYYYWFNGKKLLDRPLREVLESGRPSFPFCICWANENWTRRWDGLEQEILIEQQYSLESNRRFIREVIPILQDHRYIRYQGKPVLLIYRASAIPDIEETVAMWRLECENSGVGPIHLCAARSWDTCDVTSLGFDAAVDFPPHHIAVKDARDQVTNLDPEFEGILYDYAEVVRSNLESKGFESSDLCHRTVMTAWDNTPRRGKMAHIAHGASPQLYGDWLRGVVEQEMESNLNPESLVFINAWNEWGEGAVLEPDEHFRRGFLEATRDAMDDIAKQYRSGDDE